MNSHISTYSSNKINLGIYEHVVGVFMCVHACMLVAVHEHVYICAWQPVVNVGLSSLTALHFTEAESFTEPGVHLFTQAGCPVSTGDSCVLGLLACIAMSSFLQECQRSELWSS